MITNPKQPIPFLDLQKINSYYHERFERIFLNFLETGIYVRGKYVEEFEQKFARFCGAKYCIGVGNGLDAITLILRGYIALGKIRPGDEIIVASNTFIATILAIEHSGLIPILVEPDEKTFNLDIHLIEKHISHKTKAILPTHLYGQLAEVKKINQIAKHYDLLVICDAAQAHGAKDTHNFVAGNLCDASSFSFYPTKNLGALGDGGAVTTNNKELSDIIKSISNYGSSKKYRNEYLGINSRLDEVQAGFLIEKLKNLSTDNRKRRKIARRYLSEIKNTKIKLPFWDGTENHVFHLFVVRVENRLDFCNYLKKKGIGYLIHYPIPPHRQKALKHFAHLNLPITEKIHDEVVSIPLNICLDTEQIDRIIKALNQY